MKRIVTIQDISCVGKCSITVALPIISAMGIETAILPTALLSTHTLFSDFTFKDLADQVKPITEHWKKEKFEFDCIYTGYLGSFEQIDLMKELFRDFKTENNFIFVDPAMGDNGRLYPTFDEKFAKHMATLCSMADVIDPNLTEACYMTDTEYKEDYDIEYIKELLKKLCALGAKVSIITGVNFGNGITGLMGLDSRNGEFFEFRHEKLPFSYHGTGDVFSSTFVGALVRGLSFEQAGKVAALYTRECIRLTIEDGKEKWYSVHFEQAIEYLLDLLKK